MSLVDERIDRVYRQTGYREVGNDAESQLVVPIDTAALVHRPTGNGKRMGSLLSLLLVFAQNVLVCNSPN